MKELPGFLGQMLLIRLQLNKLLVNVFTSILKKIWTKSGKIKNKYKLSALVIQLYSLKQGKNTSHALVLKQYNLNKSLNWKHFKLI